MASCCGCCRHPRSPLYPCRRNPIPAPGHKQRTHSSLGCFEFEIKVDVSLKKKKVIKPASDTEAQGFTGARQQQEPRELADTGGGQLLPTLPFQGAQGGRPAAPASILMNEQVLGIKRFS